MPFTDDPRTAQSVFDIILPIFNENRSNYSGITFSLSSIKEILEDHRIIKVGIEVKCDADYLFNDYGVRNASTLDLRYRSPSWRFEEVAQKLYKCEAQQK